MAKVLTQISIEKFKAPKKRKEVPDAAFSGLYLILQPTGKKSFAYRYRYTGKTRKLTLGKFPLTSLADARDKAQKAQSQLERGIDPSSDKKSPEAFDDSFKEFLKRHVSQNKSHKEVERQFYHDLLPLFGSIPIGEIQRRDVIRLMDAVVDRGSPVMANRLRATLSKFYSWANSRDLTQNNPCSGIIRPTKEFSRDRILSEDEILLFWKASNSQLDRKGALSPYGRYFQFLLMSAQRRSEVAEMRYEEINGDTWIIPAKRAKNGRSHSVPLTPLMKKILNSEQQDIGYVFSTNGRNPINNIGRAAAKLKKFMSESSSLEIPNWTPHDLRRTAASEMAKAGVYVEVIEKVQNRSGGKLGGVAGVYNRYDYAKEKREALTLWCETIERLVRP